MNKTTLFGLSLLAVIVLLGFSFGWFGKFTISTESSTWDKINQEKLMDMINDPNVIIVDLREEYLFEKSHIPNAINIPFTEIEKRFKKLDKDKQIVFVCHSGPMGDASSELLINKGYKNIANLQGGMAGWSGPLNS